jgi:hypothetical protein
MPQKRTKKTHQPATMETEKLGVSTVELPANLVDQVNEEAEKSKKKFPRKFSIVGVFAEWVNEEESRDRADWFPCRPLVGVGIQEGEDLEDPERVVLFEDIQVTHN